MLAIERDKETSSVDDTDYAIMNRIHDESVFDWWVHNILKRQERLIEMANDIFYKLILYLE
jgi:hypothetical protein